MPETTIIIPTLNSARYLAEALQSIANQTYHDLETIIIDGGSTDGTLELIGQANQTGLILLSQQGRGLSAARNHGLAHAKGTFISFLDSDDLFLPDHLDESLRFMKDEGLDLVFTDAWIFHEDHVIAGDEGPYFRTKRVLPTLPYRTSPSNESYRVFERSIFTALLVENFIPFSSVVCRKRVLEDCGGFNEEYQQAEDRELWLRLAPTHRIGYIARPLIRRRLHDRNLTNDKYTQYRYLLKLFRELTGSAAFRRSWPRLDDRLVKQLDSQIKSTYYRVAYEAKQKGLIGATLKHLMGYILYFLITLRSGPPATATEENGRH